MDQENLIDDIHKDRVYYFRFWPLLIWSLFLVIGIGFRIMHWPGSSLLILTTTAGLTAWTWTELFFLKPINGVIKFYRLLTGIWFLVLLWGAFFNGGYPYNTHGIFVFLVVFAFYTLFYALLKRFAKFYKRPA